MNAFFRRIFPAMFPSEPLTPIQNRTFLLVGLAALFAGYDMNVYGLAIPQILGSFDIPANQAGPTVSIFRLAAIFAIMLCASADLIGRRRLLLITIVGQAIATFATAFAADYTQFVAAQTITRIFGYAEEMLCFVVVAEIMAQSARGWGSGALSALYYLGAGFASLVFSQINNLPYGWRAIYICGSVPLLLVAYLRRNLPETERFTTQVGSHLRKGLAAKIREALRLVQRLFREHPGRVGAIVAAVIGFGFAISPATVLYSQHLQTELHYTPGQTTLLLIGGGIIGLIINVLTGRASDWLGRKNMILITASICVVSFALFYNLPAGRLIPVCWVLGFAGYFAADALLAGFALEIVPTDYRATMSGLRYFVEIMAGAVSLGLQGVLYDALGGSGPAITVALLAIPITLISVLFLPEPSGKSLEELTVAP